MFSFKILATSLLAATLLLPAQDVLAQSKFKNFDFTRRAVNREQKRWTLSEWLEQRDRSRMMDLWLSFNSPSPYELMLGGSYLSYERSIDSAPVDQKNYQSIAGEFSAYAQNFGLTAEYENNTQEKFSDLSGIFNLRLFGNSIQDSFFNVSYGLRTRTYNEPTYGTRVAQQFGQASLQLYVAKFFGIDGQYRYYLPTTHDTLGDLKSDEVEGGVFIDFGALRVFGRWYQEKNKAQASGSTTEVTTERKGLKSGIKIFF